MTAFNRTTVECKFYYNRFRYYIEWAFNRTTVECKWRTFSDK
mgnify:CR=1 FL=1